MQYFKQVFTTSFEPVRVPVLETTKNNVLGEVRRLQDNIFSVRKICASKFQLYYSVSCIVLLVLCQQKFQPQVFHFHF